MRQKRESYWTRKIDTERTCPLKLWMSVDALMRRLVAVME